MWAMCHLHTALFSAARARLLFCRFDRAEKGPLHSLSLSLFERLSFIACARFIAREIQIQQSKGGRQRESVGL